MTNIARRICRAAVRLLATGAALAIAATAPAFAAPLQLFAPPGAASGNFDVLAVHAPDGSGVFADMFAFHLNAPLSVVVTGSFFAGDIDGFTLGLSNPADPAHAWAAQVTAPASPGGAYFYRIYAASLAAGDYILDAGGTDLTGDDQTAPYFLSITVAPPSSVPEPGGLALAMSALLVMAARRRRSTELR